MKLGVIALVTTLTACAANQCTPNPPPPPAGGGGDGGKLAGDAAPPADPMFVDACNHLAALGCGDGKYPDCPRVLEQVMKERLRPIDVPCMMAAKDMPAARLCGATCR